MIRMFTALGKINFVDDKNMFVGFDYEQQCGEDFGYIISRTKIVVPEDNSIPCPQDRYKLPHNDVLFTESDFRALFNYTFSPSFVPVAKKEGCVVFELVSEKEGEPRLYLILYNLHNGYYAHGFEYGHINTIGKGDI